MEARAVWQLSILFMYKELSGGVAVNLIYDFGSQLGIK